MEKVFKGIKLREVEIFNKLKELMEGEYFDDCFSQINLDKNSLIKEFINYLNNTKKVNLNYNKNNSLMFTDTFFDDCIDLSSLGISNDFLESFNDDEKDFLDINQNEISILFQDFDIKLFNNEENKEFDEVFSVSVGLFNNEVIFIGFECTYNNNTEIIQKYKSYMVEIKNSFKGRKVIDAYLFNEIIGKIYQNNFDEFFDKIKINKDTIIQSLKNYIRFISKNDNYDINEFDSLDLPKNINYEYEFLNLNSFNDEKEKESFFYGLSSENKNNLKVFFNDKENNLYSLKYKLYGEDNLYEIILVRFFNPYKPNETIFVGFKYINYDTNESLYKLF